MAWLSRWFVMLVLSARSTASSDSLLIKEEHHHLLSSSFPALTSLFSSRSMTTDWRIQLNTVCQNRYGPNNFEFVYTEEKKPNQADNDQRWKSKCKVIRYTVPNDEGIATDYGTEWFKKTVDSRQDAARRMLDIISNLPSGS
ncbi:hypothetical protein PIIN_11028 [Serendipita indica DSM 11827]|uniref:Uncharacterized protein n=1 Tax=Serendipita indica (strain DSM 11827) TaxID=1109443 RepID=G4U0F0_SERID|nr:hypothetical protein PIIN_11028 [Serendipita indica DSM 11827]